jgi:hypothetical protein
MKKVFIAATSQNDGKTTVSLGLISNFQQQFKRIGFIKPIGQRYLEEEGLKIDEDSVLIEEVCGIKAGLKDMSPIAVGRGFTEHYIARPDRDAIARRIKGAYSRISRRQEMVVIEGTGHAGVGSVFDHSNAAVARLLGSKVILISSGGVGRPIDEIVLNKALFDKEGVKILGVIVNKVLPEKFDKINNLVRMGLERKGIRVLGVVPFTPSLSYPCIDQLLEETNFELLCGGGRQSNYVSRIVVGAMRPQNALKYLSDDSLLIIPGDSEDVITAALREFRQDDRSKLKLSGMILSGGILPDKPIMDMLIRSGIPVMLAKLDTYSVVAKVRDLTIKIRPHDTAKIRTVVKLINDYVDLDAILRGI